MKHEITLLTKKANMASGRKILVVVLAAICLATSAFASGEETKAKAVISLKKSFSTAEDIQWKITDNYIKASFKWNNQYLTIFYNNDGETIAESRLIETGNLPIKAQQYIQSNYADHEISEVIEYNSADTGLCYYASAAKDGKKKILKILPDGDVRLFRP